VDAIATDHAPHEPASKAVEFDKAPFGITGFETALALAIEQLYLSGCVSLMRLVELFTAGPGARAEHRAGHHTRRTCRSDAILAGSRVDLPGGRFREQIAQHAV